MNRNSPRRPRRLSIAARTRSRQSCNYELRASHRRPECGGEGAVRPGEKGWELIGISIREYLYGRALPFIFHSFSLVTAVCPPGRTAWFMQVNFDRATGLSRHPTIFIIWSRVMPFCDLYTDITHSGNSWNSSGLMVYYNTADNDTVRSPPRRRKNSTALRFVCECKKKIEKKKKFDTGRREFPRERPRLGRTCEYAETVRDIVWIWADFSCDIHRLTPRRSYDSVFLF